MHYEGYNIMMSSLLSALQMAKSTVSCRLPLVAQVILIIYASSVFMLPVQPNHSAFGTFSGSNEQIAFYSERDGNQEIYVMNVDGSNQTKLTSVNANDSDPGWSPDRTKIAFESDRDGNSNIYVMNADGSGLTRLTDDPADDSNPRWSPDGTKISFNTNRDSTEQENFQNQEIYVMNAADGSNQTRLTYNDVQDTGSSWSPDGTKIAFASEKDGNPEIYLMNAADGSGQTRLTNTAAAEGEPDW